MKPKEEKEEKGRFFVCFGVIGKSTIPLFRTGTQFLGPSLGFCALHGLVRIVQVFGGYDGSKGFRIIVFRPMRTPTSVNESR
jgi:hypothetical protein